jgi:hypothetical protein
VIEYARKWHLSKHSAWQWTEAFDIDALEDLRRSFLAKYEYTPKYKFGAQIPTSIPHALRLDRLNGDLGQEAIGRWINCKITRHLGSPRIAMISPLTSRFPPIWCLIANLMADERGD